MRRLYINKDERIICETVKEIKCPEDVWGVGEYESESPLKNLQKRFYIEEGFTVVTTKQFKDSLKRLNR